MFPSDDERNPYLQQEIYSASPTRLRWLLICRAEELCKLVGHLWQTDQADQADQWLLRLREILGELLAGITSGDDPLRKTVSDLYVFLIQQIIELEQTPSLEKLGRLQEILNIEVETWKQVIEHQAEDERGASQASDQPGAVATPSTTESFSLEA